MKKLILSLVLVAALFSCSKDSVEPTNEENTIIGRWHLVGFEETVMYVFTENLRYTIYSTDGTFGDLDTAIPNPNSWSFDDDRLVIDLNFGNFLNVTPEFKCDGNVVDFLAEDGTTNSTLFRESYDISNCN